MHYSDDHRHVLAFCAKQANRILLDRHDLHVDPEELMEEGWWRCLRRQEPGNLKPAIGHTVTEMVRYAVEFYVARYGRPRAHGFADTEERRAIENLPLSEPGPWERIVETETYDRQRTAARSALHKLDPQARKIIMQRVFRGLPFTRMGREWGESKQTMGNRYNAAMRQLREAYPQGESL